MHTNADRTENQLRERINAGRAAHTIDSPDILRLTRMIIEQDKSRDVYETLNLYCDLVSHSTLDRNKAGLALLKGLSDAFVEAGDKPPTELTDAINSALHLTRLRHDLIDLFDKKVIPNCVFKVRADTKSL